MKEIAQAIRVFFLASHCSFDTAILYMLAYHNLKQFECELNESDLILGTNFEVAFSRGHSVEMDQIIQKAKGIYQWKMEFGMNVALIPVFFSEIFIVLEMVRFKAL